MKLNLPKKYRIFTLLHAIINITSLFICLRCLFLSLKLTPVAQAEVTHN